MYDIISVFHLRIANHSMRKNETDSHRPFRAYIGVGVGSLRGFIRPMVFILGGFGKVHRIGKYGSR